MSGRVLIVEDEQMLASVLARLLRRQLSFAVELAPNGQVGLDKANADPYDLILSDIKMPEMDGITMVRVIREGGGPNKSTPIVLLTGYHDEGLRASEELGTGFVGKPFRRPVLLDAIKEQLP